MTVTDQQARAIAFLAAAARPHGASRWDEAGVVANVLKVRDRDLGMVVVATIQAAADRNVGSPGVIPKPGPHWRAPDPQVVSPRPDQAELHDSCSVCLLSQPEHERRWAGDHEFDRNLPPVVDAARRAERLEWMRGCVGDAQAERRQATPDQPRAQAAGETEPQEATA